MTQYIHFNDPNSPEMLRVLETIPKCPGTCFFMDINKSTDLKYSGGVKEWGRNLNNTFNVLLYSNHFEKYLVKGIGDEVMLFIPDDELKKRPTNNTFFALLEDIFASLFIIRNHPDPGLFINCKVAIHYCTEVYNISFFEGADDYYGSDIDLTARLMTKSIENRIVLSERFYTKALNDLASAGLPLRSGCLTGVSEKFMENFKGVPVSVEYRVIDVGF
jgi:class 3 adenylate cyclase